MPGVAGTTRSWPVQHPAPVHPLTEYDNPGVRKARWSRAGWTCPSLAVGARGAGQRVLGGIGAAGGEGSRGLRAAAQDVLEGVERVAEVHPAVIVAVGGLGAGGG